MAAQWIRICLPVQETSVRSLVREDSTHRGATKPVHRNYRSPLPEPGSHNKRSHYDEKPTMQQRLALPLQS